MPHAAALKKHKYCYDIFLRPAALPQRFAAMVRKGAHVLSPTARPQSLELGLTYRCQLSCAHCGVSGVNGAQPPEIGLDEATRIIDEAARLGIYLLVCGGGEPLLHAGLDQVVAHAKRRGMLVGISTNGWDMSTERAQSLRRHGTVFANVSIDSAEPGIHNSNRGNAQSFQRAITAVAACVQAGISTIVSTCVSRQLIAHDGLPALIKLARRLGAHGVRLLFPVPSGRWFGCGNALLSPADVAYIRRFLDPVYVYVEGVCNTFSECNALLKKLLYVSPEGNVQPCSFVPVSFGNVRDTPLRVIWRKMTEHYIYRVAASDDCMMRDERVRAFIGQNGSSPGGYPLCLVPASQQTAAACSPRAE